MCDGEVRGLQTVLHTVHESSKLHTYHVHIIIVIMHGPGALFRNITFTHQERQVQVGTNITIAFS